MFPVIRKSAFLLLATFGLAAGARADSAASCMVYTPGYFIDEASWAKATTSTYRYYKDYEQERQFGYQPSISPYAPNGAAVLDWTGYNQLTLALTNNTTTSAGRYVASWNGYVWDAASKKPVSSTPKFSYTGYPESFTVTYAMLKGSTAVAVVPQLNMISYRLGYNSNGGTWVSQPATTSLFWTNAVTVAAADTTTRTGYTFLGWNMKADGTGLSFAPEQVLADPSGGSQFNVDANGAQVTLYAQWKANDYTLQLRPGNGIEKIYYKARSSGEATSTSLQWKSTATSLDVPVAFDSTWYACAVAKPGYTYTAYTADKPLSAKMGDAGATFAPAAAANTIRVSYNGNGKTSGSMSASEFEYDTPTKLADLGYTRAYTVTYKANYAGGDDTTDTATYVFLNWNSAADGSGTYSYADGETVTNPCGSTGGDVTLYAQWKPVTVKLANPVRAGSEFQGWYYDAACSQLAGRADELYLPTKDVTLYAKWNVRSYTVTFFDKSGEQVIRTEAVAYGGSATAPTAPARDGESFAQWSSDDYGQVTKDLTICAEYEAVEYHVTYNSNYGDGREERAVVSVGCGPYTQYTDRIELLDVDDDDLGYAKTGYKFVGWAWAANATTADFVAGKRVAYNQIADRLTAASGETQSADLYAVWQPITYTLRFNPGIATGKPVEQTLTYDRPARLLPNPYTLDSQRFLGWKVEVSSTSTSYFGLFSDQQEISNLTQTASTTFTLTALWDGHGDHTVEFVDATSSSRRYQPFFGTNAQYLASNQFTRAGYEFQRWTNSIGVVYQDRELYQFPVNAPRYSTNTLYAVWEPPQYTIIFNTSTNNVDGRMDPVTFCATNDLVVFLNYYNDKSIVGNSLSGWTSIRGSADVEFPVLDRNYTQINSSNLVDRACNGVVTLYAVWEGLGELSKAAGLTNAVLNSDTWQVGSEANFVTVTSIGKNKYQMSSTVLGPGKFSFSWWWDVGGNEQDPSVYFGFYDGAGWNKVTNVATKVWKTNTFEVATTGECTVVWSCELQDGYCSFNDLRVKDVTWTPRDQEQVAWTNYVLTYTNTMGATLPGTLPKTYAVTNETFEFESLDDVEGYKFLGWAPAKIEKFTTGDITVRALWEKVVTPCTVTWALDEGLQWVTGESGAKSVPATVRDDIRPPTNVTGRAGWQFAGWFDAETNLVITSGGAVVDAEALRVKGDATFTARAEKISYRIDYENTRGVVNTNRLGFTVDDLPVTVGPLDDLRDAKFVGWQRVGADGALGDRALPFVIPAGTTTNVTLRAVWSDQAWYTVRYELVKDAHLAHLARMGGGALVQSVTNGATATEPEIQADEGYDWTWTDPVTNGTDVTIRGVATAKRYALKIDGVEGKVSYGESVTATAAVDEKTENGTNIVCVGWVGSGNVPASGTSTQVTFTATGNGAINWLYKTNYFVSVTATAGGSVAILDAHGEACAASEFWSESGSRFFLTATPAAGCLFAGWEADGPQLTAEGDSAELMVLSAVSVWARFKRPANTVTFVLDSCLTQTGGGALEQAVEYGAAAVAPTVVSDAGHEFVGWNPADFSSVISNMTIRSVVRDKTCSVLFVLGDHLVRTGGGALQQTVTYGAGVDVPTVDVDEGYQFAGWYDANGNPVDVAALRVTSDTTLTGLAEEQDTDTPYLSVDVADGCEGMGTVSGGNQIVTPGKKVTVKAKVKKGFVFSGWYEGTVLVSTAASYSFSMPRHDVSLVAKFITSAEDAASVRLRIAGQTLIGEGGEEFAVATNIWAGVYVEWPVAASAASAVTVKVSGLPSGLKFTAKDVVDRKTKLVTVPANTIYGTPKTGGKTSKVKITVTTAGKTKVVSTMSVTVAAPPTAMIGTYSGGSTNDPAGTASVTLSKACKISGKWISEGLTWKITATGFTGYDVQTETFAALATFKCGKESVPVVLTLGLDADGFGVVECDFFTATCVNWKTEPWKSVAKVLKGATFEFAETGVSIFGKVGSNGAVTLKGEFDVGSAKPYTASVKSSLTPLGGDCFELFVYFPPKETKGFGGYATRLVLRWTGEELEVE